MRLNNALMRLLTTKSDEYRQVVEPLVVQIDKTRDSGAKIVAAYRKEWEKAREIVESLYQETNDKVDKFKAVATTFKERTMDRTRQLFGDRGAKLDDYDRILQDCVTGMREMQ